MKEKKCKCAASAVLPWQVDIFGCERGYLREQEGSLLHGIVPEAVGWISGSSEMGVCAAERQYRKKSLAHKKAPAV